MRYRILYRVSTTIISAMMLVSCATTEKFIRLMDDQIGQPLSTAQQNFGYNYVKRELTDGNSAYTWSWIQRELSPGFRTPGIIRTWRSKKGTHTYYIPGTYFPPEYYEYMCEFTFIVNSLSQIVSWRAHGNGCAYYLEPENIFSSITNNRTEKHEGTKVPASEKE